MGASTTCARVWVWWSACPDWNRLLYISLCYLPLIALVLCHLCANLSQFCLAYKVRLPRILPMMDYDHGGPWKGSQLRSRVPWMLTHSWLGDQVQNALQFFSFLFQAKSAARRMWSCQWLQQDAFSAESQWDNTKNIFSQASLGKRVDGSAVSAATT